MKETSYWNENGWNKSCWDKFMHSGRVEDYLHFKSKAGLTEASEELTGSSAADRIKEEQDSKKGDYPHAGFCDGNGNSTKGDAYR